MSNLERLQKLMSEIGPLVDGIEAIDKDGDDYWVFTFGEDILLHIQFDEEAKKLILSTDLGTPVEEHRPAIYEALLAFNYFWNETGGVRMAIDAPENGNVVQVLDLYALDLDVSTLGTVIANFLDKAAYWQDFIAHFQPGQAADDAGTEPPHEQGPGGAAIRV